MKGIRFVKVAFEHVSLNRICDVLGDKYEFVGGDDSERVAIFYTDASTCSIQDDIWKLNGGAYCEIIVISEDDAEAYM